MSSEIENVALQLTGNTLALVLDVSKRLGLSSSGKTITVATTHGFHPVTLVSGETLYLSLNAYVYPSRYKKHSTRSEGGSI